MGGILRAELYRAFHSKRFVVCLGIGVAIALLQVVSEVIPAATYLYQGYMKPYPQSVFMRWIGGVCTEPYQSLYFFVLPLLAAGPHAGSYAEDRAGGYASQVAIRTERHTYLLAKITSIFLSAGCIAVIPLVINLLASCLVLPALVPQVGTALFPLFQDSLMSELYYTHPFAYVAAYFAIDFVFIGLLTTLALVPSLVLTRSFAVSMVPFIIYLVTFVAGAAGNSPTYVPFLIVQIHQPLTGLSFLVIGLECATMAAVAAGCVAIATRRDVL